MNLEPTIDGGFTRICADCGHKWAVGSALKDELDACPECGYRNAEGEDTYDWTVCPGCGKENLGPNATTGFPGQRYCSAQCAGLI